MSNVSLKDDTIKLELLRLLNNKVSQRGAGRELGLPESTIRAFLSKKTHKNWWIENDKPVAGGNIESHHNKIKSLKGGRYLFTSAQNNTYVHSKVLDTLKVASEYLDAPLMVGSFSYNTNGFMRDQDEFWYDPLIRDHIKDETLKIAEGLLWCGELNISPTAVNPFSGLQSYTGESSCIFPHAKLQLESVATPKHLPAKKMYTTGCVTQRNYIPRKEGQKAEFHHSYGASLVEIDEDGTWFVFQLIADSDTGEIQFGDVKFTTKGVTEGVRVEGINYGDIHSEKRDELCYQMSFGKATGSLLDQLRPYKQFCNDILDFEVRNHHNINDPFFRFAQQVIGSDKVEDDLLSVVETLNMMDRPWCTTVIVESNHDLALKKWVQEGNFRSDNISNAIFLLKCQRKTLECIRDGVELPIFKWALEELGLAAKPIFLKEDQSYRICTDTTSGGIECGSHGHLGANGGRPSKMTFARSGAKHNTGHTHAFSIFEGAWCAGITCLLEMGYNKGYSSWSQGHIITYLSGKRCIFEFKNGKFRATRLRGEG